MVPSVLIKGPKCSEKCLLLTNNKKYGIKYTDRVL